ncbi:MAG: filamentous hemagglutinin N-terminal domain-containing protein [Calothrix sp. C42_A2020_038]|nr:filamentous hemagglutinin N-terminal domain-containing protein [Calothrix sp. C42_A2020_038]
MMTTNSVLYAAVIVYFITSIAAHAQIVPDATLPTQSVVTPDQERINITGGTQTGANLFHSFTKFSVRAGESVYFDNPRTVENIIMRVTGRDISNIDGLIRAAGNINLYLLNPNGINFGKNAALDINGSLFASTATLIFPDGMFNAIDTTSPLLSVSAPIGIQWGNAQGDIQLSTTNLLFRDVKLVGNNITVTGSFTTTGNLNLAARTINLDAAVINLTHASNASFQADVISISNGSQVISSAITQDGSNITIKSNHKFIMKGETTGLFSDTAPGSKFNGGNISIQAPTIEIKDKAKVNISNQGSGNSGNLQLFTDNLNIKGGTLSAKTAAEGGNISVLASELLLLGNNGTISTLSRGQGNGGNINVQAGFVLVNPNENNDITTSTTQGYGGRIKISSNAIFGLEIRPSLTPRSDISVTSPFKSYKNYRHSGNINLDTLNIDPNQGVNQLPISVLNVSKQINQTCSNQVITNRFTIIGRGGLPLTPSEALNRNSGWIDWRLINRQEHQEATLVEHQIVEATRWEVENGEVILVAAPDVPSQNEYDASECLATVQKV